MRIRLAGIDQSVLIAAATLAIALVTTIALNRFIPIHFPDRPVVPDLLFELTPNVSVTQYVADAVVFAAPLLALGFLAVARPARIPFAITVVALAELARAILMTLTPLGPSFPGAQYGLTDYPQYGQFPSGHTIVVVGTALTAMTTGSRRTLGLLALIEMAALILSRGHYSIDVAGGVLVVYASYKLLEPYVGALSLPTTKH